VLPRGGKRKIAKMMAAVSEPVTLTLTPNRRDKSTNTTTNARGRNPRNVELWNSSVKTEAKTALRTVPMVKLMGCWSFFNIRKTIV
jgi:hypothetical protein